MFPHMDLLKDYGQYWFVTITPYGRDIEPNVPDKHRLPDDFKRLSDMVGLNSIGWRYDPIFVSERYTTDYHYLFVLKYDTGFAFSHPSFSQISHEVIGYLSDA